jgi:hypothetical protein
MVAVPDALGGIWSRALNLGIALAVLVLFMPLFVLIAIAVRLSASTGGASADRGSDAGRRTRERVHLPTALRRSAARR